ncbi:MAG TPA: hypothetical protein VFN67_09785, partial [Polyangiales bacterium]|nr:hypothetical protein [Polyangiales bacterium]
FLDAADAFARFATAFVALSALADFAALGLAAFADFATGFCARLAPEAPRFVLFVGFALFAFLLDRFVATVFAAALLRTDRTARVATGAAAFKRFSTTGGVSSSPATRARAAPIDRAGAERREDGKAAPAADLLAFVFMAINVLGWRKTRTRL